MNILAFDTTMGACSVCAVRGYGSATPSVARIFERMDKGQAERLVPMIGEALAEAGLPVSDVQRLATTAGPGTFTGSRICVAAARALSLAVHVPVVSLSSLEVVAFHPAIPAGGQGQLMVAMNANRGEAYVQMFDARTRAKASEPMLLPLYSAAQTALGAVIVAGTASEMVLGELGAARGTIVCGPVDLQPDIADAIDLAAGSVPLALPPRPLYLRPPDAKPQDGKSLARDQ